MESGNRDLFHQSSDKQEIPWVPPHNPGINRRRISLLILTLILLLVLIFFSFTGVKQGKRISHNTMPSSATFPTASATTPVPQSQQLVFGANLGIASDSDINIDEAVDRFKSAHLTEIPLWIYLPDFIDASTHKLIPDKLLQFVNSHTSLGDGLVKVRIHIMPQTTAQAKSKGGFYLPEDLEDYSLQVRDLVKTLQPQVKYYSISNESPVLWGGTLQDYFTLLRTSYAAIKSQDPGAVVLDSGLESGQLGLMVADSYFQEGEVDKATNFINGYFSKYTALAGLIKARLPVADNDEAELREILDLPFTRQAVRFGDQMFTDLCPYYDELQIHYYSQWEYFPEVIDLIKKQMARHHCQKPIQIWELGYGLDKNLPYHVIDHAQAIPKYLSIAASASNFINYFIFYDKGTPARGLYNADGSSKPTAISFKVAVSKLKGATYVQKLDLGDNVWAYQFTKSGKKLYSVWGVGKATVSLPEDPDIRMNATDINGESKKVSPGRLAITSEPLFIEEE